LNMLGIKMYIAVSSG